MPKQSKFIPMQVVVSIPRAGEFIITTKVDPKFYSDADAKISEIKADLIWDTAEEIENRVVIKPGKGEAQRVAKLLKARAKAAAKATK